MIEFPEHLDIESTNACQLKCSICPRKDMKRKVGFMSFELLKKIIDEAKGYTKTCYLHQIGEPLLHPEIIKFINYTSDAGIRTSISTNCMALDSAMARKLLDSKLDELSIAIDAIDKDSYNKMRIGGKFFDVMFNISNLLSMAKGCKLLITIQLVKTKYNQDQIETWKDYFTKKAKGCNFEILTKDFSTFAGAVDDVGIIEAPELRHKCKKAWRIMTINWDGTVVVCCRDYDKFHIIGDANKESLSAIWWGENFMKIRKAFDTKQYPDFCKNC